MAAKDYTTLDVDGRELRLPSPAKVYFPAHDGRPEITKRPEGMQTATASFRRADLDHPGELCLVHASARPRVRASMGFATGSGARS